MGIAVGADAVHAVLVRRGSIAWAGRATYDGLNDLAEVIARLAGEGNGVARPGRVCAVLERQVVQLRTIAPAPPLKLSAVRRWVELEAPRLFRKNRSLLVTDARFVRIEAGAVALWAAAAPEPLLDAVLAGGASAGLAIATIGIAAEVLPAAAQQLVGPIVVANGRSAESVETTQAGPWRSRLVRPDVAKRGEVAWNPSLDALGAEAAHFASAFGAAIGSPHMVLLPKAERRIRERESNRVVIRLAAVAASVWLIAVAVYAIRLSWSLHTSTAFLASVRSSVDSVVAGRRDLATARAAVAVVTAAEAARSRHLTLLKTVATALPDSAYLVSWQVTPDHVIRLSGYAPMAARVLAALEGVKALQELRFEGRVSRETVLGVGERDRFAIIARLDGWP